MAEDDALVGKTYLIGDTALKIVEPVPIPTVFADIYTEVRIVNGNVCLSLASIAVDGDNTPEAHICTRLRMTIETAANIQTAINRALENLKAMSEAAKENAN